MDDLQRIAGASAQAAFWDDVRRRQALGRRSVGDALHFGFFAGIGIWFAFLVCTVVLVVALILAGFGGLVWKNSQRPSPPSPPTYRGY